MSWRRDWTFLRLFGFPDLERLSLPAYRRDRKPHPTIPSTYCGMGGRRGQWYDGFNLSCGRVEKRRDLFVEQFRLSGSGGFARAPGHADDAENLHFLERRPWDKDSQAVTVDIWRGQLHTGVEQVEEVVGDDAFHYVVVAEPDANPKPVELGTAQEQLALRLKGLEELAHEMDGLDLVEDHGLVFAVRGEQIELVGMPQGRGVQVALGGGAVEKQNHYLFESRGWRPAFQRLKAFMGRMLLYPRTLCYPYANFCQVVGD